MAYENEERKQEPPPILVPPASKWPRLQKCARLIFSTQTAITILMIVIVLVFARQNACQWIPMRSFYWYDQFDCYSHRGDHLYPVH